MKKIEKFEDDVPGAPVIFEPWDDFYATVAKIAAEHPHRGDDDELAFNEEPIARVLCRMHRGNRRRQRL